MIEREGSRDLLARSLLQLVRSEPLPKITVSRIALNCSVSRETFYYYFAGKDDLVYWIFRQDLDRHVAEGRFTQPIVDAWARCLADFRRRDFFYRQAFSDAALVERARGAFAEMVSGCVARRDPAALEDDDIAFAIDLYTSGLLRVTVDWLCDPAGRDCYDASRRMCVIMPQVLKPFYLF